jgi:hypothetical protein
LFLCRRSRKEKKKKERKEKERRKNEKEDEERERRWGYIYNPMIQCSRVHGLTMHPRSLFV